MPQFVTHVGVKSPKSWIRLIENRTTTAGIANINVKVATEIYVCFLGLLRDIGVFSQNTNLVYPACGADLFPFCFSKPGMIGDLRLDLSAVNNYYRTICEEVIFDSSFLLPEKTSIVFCRSDLTTQAGIEEWASMMKPQDVLLLKCTEEYVMSQNDPTFNPHKWLSGLVSELRSGVRIVCFEAPGKTSSSPFREGVSEYLVGTGQFNDILDLYVSKDLYKRLQRINLLISQFNRSDTRVCLPRPRWEYRKLPEVVFEAIGTIAILEKV